MVSAVIVAGGKGTRMGAGYNKVFMELLGKPIISRTISAFEACSEIDEIIIVTAEDDIPEMSEIAKNFSKVREITTGGDLRQDSVYNGLKKAQGDIVLIHDGARCFVTEDVIISVINDTKTYGAAATGVIVKDTLKSIDEAGNIIATIDREKTVQIQTPQGFVKDEIIAMHNRIKEDNITVTDDCSAFEKYGKVCHFTNGSYDNIKITTPEDIAIGEEILKRRAQK